MRTLTGTPTGAPARPATLREGFSLIEVLMAIFVLTVGVIAMASVASPIRNLQVQSQVQAEITQLAQSKMEEIRALGEGRQFGTALAVGGSLDEDVPDYFESATGEGTRTYVLRWLVEDGPSRTFTVTLRVIPTTANRYNPPPMEFQTRVMDR